MDRSRDAQTDSAQRSELLGLHELPVGERAVIDHLGGEGLFRYRLLELGLTPGVSIRSLRAAPFGGPIEVEVRDFRLILRPEQARIVSLRPIDQERP